MSCDNRASLRDPKAGKIYTRDTLYAIHQRDAFAAGNTIRATILIIDLCNLRSKQPVMHDQTIRIQLPAQP